jgi:hypothetical protein
MDMIMPSHHQARLYAAEHGNNAVEYRANSSEPWALCSPICAWNPAPFEYRKVEQRWTIDAETASGPVIRRTFSKEEIWANAIAEYLSHKITITGGRHATVHRMKVAKWKDVPRLTRVMRSDGHEFEFLGVLGSIAVLLKDFTTGTARLSDIKLSPTQLRLAVPYDQPEFLERLHPAGFRVVRNDNYTFRILGLREGWEMEQ